VAYKGYLMTVYSPVVLIERYVSASCRWETVLILILHNLRSCIKKVLNWLLDLDIVAEDRFR